MFISQTTYSEDSIYESKADNSRKNHGTTTCNPVQTQGNGVRAVKITKKLSVFLKQKLKEQLQRTKKTARNKGGLTAGLEAIGKLCRHGRIIYR